MTTVSEAYSKTAPLVYVIVLNYNGRMHLEYCLPSIAASDYQNFRVLLVDNASTDDSLDFLQTSFPNIEVLQTGNNLGWAGGNNAGIAYAIENGARYVVLANNDIRVHPQWITAAVAAFEALPDVAFVSGTVFGDVIPTPLEEYDKACARWQGIKFWRTNEFLSGMALFVDTEIFPRIGTIDEAYWAYCEETDLEIRAEAAGFARAATNVPVWHHSSGTFSRYRLRAAYLAIRNSMRLTIKHDRPLRQIKAILHIFYVGCWPFYRGNTADVTIARLRPRNVLANLGLDLYCLSWNLFNLPATIRRRRADYALVRQERDRQVQLKN
ncbi:MAG: glycosyltransferase family 2 protein [Chthoniobacter sp.]|nr:glycosyltransferase family 2 protein [Chthoniobacter sp.]